MSERNGDRARFQKNRKRKLLNRQQRRSLVQGAAMRAPKSAAQKREL